VESSSWSRKDFQPKESESQKILTTPTPGRPFAHQLWLFMPQTCVSVTLGNLSNLTLQQEMIMAIQTGSSALTCIPSLRAIPDQQRPLGLITQPTLCECNRSGLVSLKFPFAHSGWHYCCSVTLATQQWMRVLMGARLLLRNACHRTMITPVNPPCLRLIHTRVYARGFGVRVNPPLRSIFAKTLLLAQRRLLVCAYFLLVNWLT